MSKAREAADSQRQEAMALMRELLGIRDGESNGMAERLVDCIIGAAILEMASIQENIFLNTPTTQNP